MRKIELQTIVRNLLDELRKLNMNGTVTLETIPHGIENSGQYLLLRTYIFYRKLSLGAPVVLTLSRLPFVKYYWNYVGDGEGGGGVGAHPESKKIYLFKQNLSK